MLNGFYDVFSKTAYVCAPCENWKEGRMDSEEAGKVTVYNVYDACKRNNEGRRHSKFCVLTMLQEVYEEQKQRA